MFLRAACRNELTAVFWALGGGKVDDVSLDLADHDRLFEFLCAVEAHEAVVNVIKARLHLLPRPEHPNDDQIEREKFRTVVDALRSSLHGPDPESLSDRIRARRSWILIAMALADDGLAVFVNPALALLAAAGVEVAVAIIMLRSSRPASGARSTAQKAFGKLGIEEPGAWYIPSVELRLRSLDREIAANDPRTQRVRDRDVDWQSLNNELAGLSETQTVLHARRQKLADSLKLDAIPPDAELVDFAHALDQVRSARIKDESAAGKSNYLEARYTKLLSDLVSILKRHDEPQPEDVQVAVVYLNNLADCSSRLAQVISDERQATDQLEQVSTDRTVGLNSVERIYSEVGPDDGDLSGLTALLNLLPHYRDLKNAAVRLEGQIKLGRAELAKAGEAELAECDGPVPEHLEHYLSRTANEAADLRNEIAEINARVSEAKRGSNVQDLIAVHDDARTKLLDRRDEMHFAKAGKFLINAVEVEYEQTQLPRVFERARSHFSVFIHHNYELRLCKEAEALGLIAIELGSDGARGLDELSDGTRVQLLLAARIAFAEEVEQEKALTLFLGEALNQSDPAHSEAIVRSPDSVADDQHCQIFCFTSDPNNVDSIRHTLAEENCKIAAAIDLGLIRTNTTSVSGPQALHVEPRLTVPPPDGWSDEAYGVALGVPQLASALGYGQLYFSMSCHTT